MPDVRCRVAVLSLHTSPLEQPGEGDSGGMNVYIRQVALEMAKLGVPSDVFTRRQSPDEPRVSEPYPGVRVIAIDAGPPRPVHKDRLPRLVPKFVEGVAAFGSYDIVHAHYWLSGVAGADLARRWDVPLVVSFHTLARVKEAAAHEAPEPLFRKAGEDRVVDAAARIFAATDIERAELLAHYDADQAKVTVVPPGVDLDMFHPHGKLIARKRFGFEHPTIVFVGRLQQLKGPHVAVGAMARLRRLVPDAQLVIAGGDSPRGWSGELTRLTINARRLGVARRVHFMDPLPHRDLADLYRAADVVVIPSSSESFGLVALEAAACGTPVVATAVGGLMRLVRDGETGYLVSKRTAPRFAEALSRVLTDPAARERLGSNGVRLAATYPWRRTAERLIAVYRDVTECPDLREALAGVG